MNLIRCLHITNASEAIHHMEKVGVDPTGSRLMEGKTLHFNLKVEGIEPRTANLLKQEMLSLGGDVAVDGRGLDCSANHNRCHSHGHSKTFRKTDPQTGTIPGPSTSWYSPSKKHLRTFPKRHYSIRCRKQDIDTWEKEPF